MLRPREKEIKSVFTHWSQVRALIYNTLEKRKNNKQKQDDYNRLMVAIMPYYTGSRNYVFLQYYLRVGVPGNGTYLIQRVNTTLDDNYDKLSAKILYLGLNDSLSGV